MIRSNAIGGVAVALALMVSAPAMAQDDVDDDVDLPQEPLDEDIDDDLGDDVDFEDMDEDDEWPDEWDDEWDDDFDAFGDDIDFVPLDDMDDALLDRITPTSTFPFVEHSGQLRVRPQIRSRFDLGTGGTSAILAPVDTVTPDSETPADPDNKRIRSADVRLRLAPTFHITENLRIHTDVDLLPNTVLGDDPRHSFFRAGTPSPQRDIMDSSIGDPTPIQVREAYGEVSTFFGTFTAGRMLDHWGLGIMANDGNCTDCDWGDRVDRIAFRSRLFGTHVRVGYDMIDAGAITRSDDGFDDGRPLQVGRLDTAGQWTIEAFQRPMTRQQREEQAHQLHREGRATNAGLRFSTRGQDTEYDPDSDEYTYRGLRNYSLSPWTRFLWQPDSGQRIRLEFEGLANLGRVDNTTNGPVGYFDEGGDPNDPEVNCFNPDAADDNTNACRTAPDGESTDKSILQFGLAAESEFNFDSRHTFGFDAGFATGGDNPNWGYGADAADQIDFTRFNPDYHVDLILFREVIGTVTNAYYARPHVTTKFLDSGAQHFEIELATIASRAFDEEGTPAGDSPWLGLELDSSLRYIDGDSFLAALDAGVLLPFSGLDAVEGNPRLNSYEAGNFTDSTGASLAWTIQGRLAWSF